MQFSEPLVLDLSDERWVVIRTQAWDNERSAFWMEQALINPLEGYEVRMSGEFFRSPPRASVVETTLWVEMMFDAQERRRRESGAGVEAA